MAIGATPAQFIAKLLEPVADASFLAEIDAISEAAEQVARLTSTRDRSPWAGRERAVQQIMLDWWERELADCVGFARPSWRR